jgi:hypothetical protein
MKQVYIYYGIVCIFVTSCHAIEPITGLTTVAVGVVATVLTSFTAITCQFKECCTKKWIKLNVTGISSHIYMVSGCILSPHLSICRSKAH